MKFFNGQKVLCKAKKNEWDFTIPNFDEQLKIALGVQKIPEKGKVYEVKNAFQLYYNGRHYITLTGFEHNIFDESAFEPLQQDEAKERDEKTARTGMFIKN